MKFYEGISPHQNKKALSTMGGVLHSFSMKNVFYDKMNLRLFYIDVAICSVWISGTSAAILEICSIC